MKGSGLLSRLWIRTISEPPAQTVHACVRSGGSCFSCVVSLDAVWAISAVVASVGRQVLPATDTETAPSLLWFTAIQCIKSKQDLGGLAPKDCFIWSLAYV